MNANAFTSRHGCTHADAEIASLSPGCTSSLTQKVPRKNGTVTPERSPSSIAVHPSGVSHGTGSAVVGDPLGSSVVVNTSPVGSTSPLLPPELPAVICVAADAVSDAPVLASSPF